MPGPDDCWKDVKGTAVFLLGLTNPSDSIGSYSLRWYVCGLGSIDNTDSSYVLRSLRPFYSAT